jgi:GTP-binding protein
MFIDFAKIKVVSGKGGDGASTFRREKYVPKGGPDGGDGGRGGNIYIMGDENLSTLIDYYYKSFYKAKDGERGMGSNMHGKNGEDLFIKVPLGTVVKDAKTNEIIKDITKNGEMVLVAKGGRGGRGNAHFKTSTRQAPRFYEKGQPGEEKEIILELKILADVGIIGLANAGKSTLLSKISNAHPKIADYPFTTLHPVLGIVKYGEDATFVVADIPGLIEGASSGKGLGIEFLKHIERTRLYIHIIDPTQGDVIKNYKIINKELKEYNKKLIKRQQIIAINKIDLLKKSEIDEIKAKFKKIKKEVFFISAKNNINIENLIKKVYNTLKNLPEEKEEKEEKVKIIKDTKIEFIKIKEGMYKLIHKPTEDYVEMLDFNNIETLDVFKRFLTKSGIEEFLKTKGVKTGDVVIIGNKNFIYEED